jgi:hypothetical protein
LFAINDRIQHCVQMTGRPDIMRLWKSCGQTIQLSLFAVFKMCGSLARVTIFVLHPHRLAGIVHSYTLGMNPLRTLPLFDSGAQPASWNERMSPGEYAVHYSSFDSSAPGTGPSCTILGSLADAEEYAKAQVALKPGLRCRIYDHRGFVGPPILEADRRQSTAGSRIGAHLAPCWSSSTMPRVS